MFALTCRITLEPFEPFTFVHDVEIESSFLRLTDTAVVSFPRNVKIKNSRLRDVVKPGNRIKIELAYDKNFGQTAPDDAASVEFEGYVARVTPGTPVVLECEDAMWLLKRKQVSYVSGNATLPDLLRAILPPDVAVDAQSVELGKIRIDRLTVAQVLEWLHRDYGLFSFFRDGKLVSGLGSVGLRPGANPARDSVFDFQQNVVSNDLTYRTRDDVKVKVKAVSLLTAQNKKLEVEVGDPDGELHTVHRLNVSDPAQLRAIAESDLKRLQFEGYRGTLTTFGVPRVRHGDAVTLRDAEYPEREGRYLVERVKTKFGTSGFRRELAIGSKV